MILHLITDHSLDGCSRVLTPFCSISLQNSLDAHHYGYLQWNGISALMLEPIKPDVVAIVENRVERERFQS